jgi:hypothetical protein
MFEQYNRQIKHIDRCEQKIDQQEEAIKKTRQDLAQSKIALWGTPGSAFYGLKKPGKFKCLKYISDEYNVCPDIIETIQNLVIKKDNDNNIDKLKEQYMNPDYEYETWRGSDNRHPHRLKQYSNGKGWFQDDYRRPCDTYNNPSYDCPTKYSPAFKGKINIGGIEYDTRTQSWRYGVGQVNTCFPSLALSRKSSVGGQFDDCVKIIKKDDLIKACEHYTCVPYKSSWNRKQLWQHLMKYA